MESFVLAVSTKTIVYTVTSGTVFNIVADGIIVLAVVGLLFLLAVPAGYCVNADTGGTDFFLLMVTLLFKGTVSRDFLLLVFFLNQIPPSL